MNKYKYIILLLLVLLLPEIANAQSGMKFAELARRLEQYYDKELIQDVQNQLPQGSDYTIWGWDVGDFSGDGNPDVAMSVRVSAQKGRTMQVYLFVDLDGYLVKVGQYPFEFVEMPLEIGVVIRDNACYVTEKRKQFDWMIIGYRFDNGSIINLDRFTTNRVGEFTHETYTNYITLQNREKFLYTRNGKTKQLTDYLTIPSYSRGRLVYKGFQNEPRSFNVDYVPRGAWDWKGEEDLSFKVGSAYDDEFLYMTINVKDDQVVTQKCDTCIHDKIDVWFDMNPVAENQSRAAIIRNEKVDFRTKAESGLFCISLNPGNFFDKKASVTVSSTDNLEAFQKIAATNIKVISDLTKDGYVIKFKVPFMLLGIQGNPVESGKITEYGCSIVVVDYDNEFRPEEVTEKSNSMFSAEYPGTYGSLLLIPDNMWYGNTENIYREDIIKALLEYGF